MSRTIRDLIALVALGAFVSPLAVMSAQRVSPPVRTIAAAIAGHGTAADTVTLAGRATVSTGKLQSGAFDIALEDATGGIRVFSRLPQPDTREGDSVIATGVVKSYRGNLELMANTVTIVNVPLREIAARDVAIDPAVIGNYTGQLIRVRGRVAGFGHSEGGQWLRLREASPAAHGTITVWVPANHGVPVDLTAAGSADSIAVTGIVAAYQDNADDPVVWQLVPRDAHDVVLPPKPETFPLWLLWTALGIVIAIGGTFAWIRLGERRQLHALRETETRYDQLLALLPDAVIVHDKGNILFTNPAACTLLGVPPKEGIVGRELADLVHPDSLETVMSGLTSITPDALSLERAPANRARMLNTSGNQVEVEVGSSACVYHDRPATLLLARDITAQLRYERDLHALALIDELTGLQNRRAFTLFAEQELARARRNGRTPVLVFADLDGLKQINDQYGHAAGDQAIKLVASALKSIFRETDVVARWSGDEFVALMVDGTAEASQLIGARLDAAIAVQTPPRLPYVVTASVGASALDPALPLRDAMESADTELYEQKKRNRRSKIRVTPLGVDVVKTDD